MLEVWGRKTSSNVVPVMWAIGELGLKHVRHNAGGSFGGLDTHEYGEMNPNRLVPTMRDNGFRALGIPGDHTLPRKHLWSRHTHA